MTIENPMVAVLKYYGDDVTLDNYLLTSLVDPSTPPDRDRLETLPEQFQAEYADRIRLSEYKSRMRRTR